MYSHSIHTGVIWAPVIGLKLECNCGGHSLPVLLQEKRGLTIHLTPGEGNVQECQMSE